jgi:hypothetical protein
VPTITNIFQNFKSSSKLEKHFLVGIALYRAKTVLHQTSFSRKLHIIFKIFRIFFPPSSSPPLTSLGRCLSDFKKCPANRQQTMTNTTHDHRGQTDY